MKGRRPGLKLRNSSNVIMIGLLVNKRRIDNMRKSQERVEIKQCTFVPNSAKI